MRNEEARARIRDALEDAAACDAMLERKRESLDPDYRARKSAYLRGDRVHDMRTGELREMTEIDVLGAETHAQWWARYLEERGAT
jgi:hypothetical protein